MESTRYDSRILEGAKGFHFGNLSWTPPVAGIGFKVVIVKKAAVFCETITELTWEIDDG